MDAQGTQLSSYGGQKGTRPKFKQAFKTREHGNPRGYDDNKWATAVSVAAGVCFASSLLSLNAAGLSNRLPHPALSFTRGAQGGFRAARVRQGQVGLDRWRDGWMGAPLQQADGKVRETQAHFGSGRPRCPPKRRMSSDRGGQKNNRQDSQGRIADRQRQPKR